MQSSCMFVIVMQMNCMCNGVTCVGYMRNRRVVDVHAICITLPESVAAIAVRCRAVMYLLFALRGDARHGRGGEMLQGDRVDHAEPGRVASIGGTATPLVSTYLIALGLTWLADVGRHGYLVSGSSRTIARLVVVKNRSGA